MKHRNLILLLCALMLTGCSAGGRDSADSAAEDPPVMIAETHGDRNSAVRTLEELSAHSDVILRATAAELSHHVSSGTDLVMTVIKPENVVVVKGDYQGEPLVTPGGIMLMEDYCAQLGDFWHIENTGEVQYVEYHWENTPIVREGDDIVFFGEFDTDGTIRSTYFMQGTFVVKDDTVSVTEETVDEFLYEDFYARFGDAVSAEVLLESAVS